MTDYAANLDAIRQLYERPTPPPPVWFDPKGAHVLREDGTYEIVEYREGQSCLCHGW